MFAYVKDPNYMTNSDKYRGLCFGISMEQTSNPDEPDYQ
jgi:hypothetical protein